MLILIRVKLLQFAVVLNDFGLRGTQGFNSQRCGNELREHTAALNLLLGEEGYY